MELTMTSESVSGSESVSTLNLYIPCILLQGITQFLFPGGRGKVRGIRLKIFLFDTP